MVSQEREKLPQKGPAHPSPKALMPLSKRASPTQEAGGQGSRQGWWAAPNPKLPAVWLPRSPKALGGMANIQLSLSQSWDENPGGTMLMPPESPKGCWRMG